MKAKPEDIVRRFHAGSDQFRLVLLCGPNVTRCQALVEELVKPLAQAAERVDLTIGDIADGPARLNDEANSASLFGDKRFLVLRLNSGEAVRATAAIDYLLASETAGDPVFVIAPGMGDKTALAKSIIAAPDALIATCYETTPQQAAAAIQTMAQTEGLRLSREMAQEIAALTSNDLVLARMEVEKIALYLDATPENPLAPEDDILLLLGAENDEEDINLLIHAALNGDAARLAQEIAATRAQGISEIGLIRIMLRHLSKLAELRSKVDKGGNVDAVAGHPSVFFKEQKHFKRQLRIWSSAHIARLIERILQLEIAMKSSGQPDQVLLEEELLLIARKAASGR
ncbi:DNA polymerase III subunit delta [Sphingorhabdus sp. YGSMI21]|uniref:DNA polymerase III subunit delta n=1 Tax=Sphingorhabdus sp. YGSMI21 TaxID=2077182 RepID=UPI000C1F5E61|nr:DNA polymerase III subunit delta [Sphingorhabdus sp. YGSMI21]ATW02988.1 DNA polymerase III subunit delta [Sphingorhabdus sp. YGSMI21]